MPRNRAAGAQLLVSLDPSRNTPLYRQLYRALRQAILDGGIAAGTRLPSTRLLAEELGISRNTVVLAFDQLTAEGYLAGSARSSTRVAATLPQRTAGAPRATPARASSVGLSARGRAIAAVPPAATARGGTEPRPFRSGVPALDEFPRELWARLTARRWRRPPVLGYGEVAGYAPLREAIADYVRAARGAPAALRSRSSSMSGSQQGIDLAARVLLDPGDAVWMEEPGYPGARTALLAAGARLVPVPVDGEGLAGRARAGAWRRSPAWPTSVRRISTRWV